MTVIDSVKFLLKILKVFGCLPFSASTFDVKFFDVFYPVAFLACVIIFYVLRLVNNDGLAQMGSDVSKLTLNISFGFSVMYLVVRPVSNMINRQNFKDLVKKIEWIEKKVKI